MQSEQKLPQQLRIYKLQHKKYYIQESWYEYTVT